MKTSNLLCSAMMLAALGATTAVLGTAAMAQSKSVDTTPSKHLGSAQE